MESPRDVDKPVESLLESPKMSPGFSKALIGLREGDSQTLTLSLTPTMVFKLARLCSCSCCMKMIHKYD